MQQLQRVLAEADYLDPYQLGFRPEHGKETAVIMLLDSLWHGCASILPLLVLSAAFDSINHGILLHQPRRLDVGGWFSSFLWD